MRKTRTMGLVVLITLGAWSSVGWADVAATVDPDAIDTGHGYPRADINWSSGWRFFVDQEMTITHVGLYDDGDDGLLSTHTMGIWRVEKEGGLTLLRQVDIGPGGTTEDHHVYVDIEDITLVPDPVPGSGGYFERWLVGVWTGADNTDGLTIRPREAATIDAEDAGVITIEDYTWVESTTFTAPWGSTSNDDHFGVNFKYTTAGPEPTPVNIDIKPGSYPNSVNINEHGVIPVAILAGTGVDDLTQIDVLSLTLEGMAVKVKGNGTPQCAFDDVNGDGLEDLVVKFLDQDWSGWETGTAMATLGGQLLDGVTQIEGQDEITIVPPE